MRSSAVGRHGRSGRTHMENIKQPKYGYARARAEIHGTAPVPMPSPQQQRNARATRLPPKASSNAGHTKRMRFLSKSDKGWSWLSVQMRDVASEVKMGMARKGELPPELVQALWGRQGLKTCCKAQEAVIDHIDQKIQHKASIKHPDSQDRKSTDKKNKSPGRVPETLMDVLLQKWVYFDHSHSDVSQVDRHVHAKYCENAFGHFLLPDGRQVHGSYSVPLSHLVQELKKLLTHLRGKIVNTHYKPLPVFTPPEQQELPEFEPPQMKPLPQLYPIEGLLPIPTEESEGIGADLPLPVFKAPVPRELPVLELPPPLRPPPLKLPLQPVFLEDEGTIDKSRYKEDPLPTYEPPERLPLPEWQEPKLLEYPTAPIPVKAPLLPMPVLESMPPFVPPIPEPRPCEKSYYAVGEDARTAPICDGMCMANMDPYARKGKPCQAKPRPLLALPEPPHPLPLQLKPEPTFLSTEGEPLPNFQPPVLKEKPEYVPPPPLVLPPWKPPPSPDPIGYLAGQRPIFLIDCSGTMARGGMKMAHEILSALFAPRGQVSIAATHFDIIMYSFDAWSYASMENYRTYKQNSRHPMSPRFWSPQEAMVEKSLASLEEALNWALRWGAGGQTNLLKALDVAFSRSFCDCIYLLTDGKPDKPVLVLQQIKRLLKAQGSVTPIYTVGLGTSKYGERFLHRIAEATGGHLRHLDKNWSRKPPPCSGTELEDMLWAKRIIENEQRKNIARGIVATISDIEEKVKARFEKERNIPRLQAYERKKKQMEQDYEALIKLIDEQNEAVMAEATKKYQEECVVIVERNRVLHEMAKEKWMEEVRRVEQQNKRAVEDVERWKSQVERIKQENDRLLEEARKQFEHDLKWTEEINMKNLQRASNDYEAECERKKAAFEARVKETERQQKEMEETVATRNRINLDNYQKLVAEIKTANEATAEKAHTEHAAKVAYIESENARLIKEAEEAFEMLYDNVKLENARRVTALQQKIQEIRQKKAEALATYKAEVAAAMAEYDMQSKKFAKLNQENEERARRNWKLACEAISAENMQIAKSAVEEYEKHSKYVHEENLRRAAQRIALMKRKAEVEVHNEQVTKARKITWKEECEQAEKDYEVEVAKAKAEYEKREEEVNAKNAEAFEAALLEHKAKVNVVETYNETVRPFVEASIQIKAEIDRVEKFIRYVANACLDPNRKSDTLADLNVLGKSEQGMETKILVEALQEAYSTKREGGNFVSRPSFYAGKDFSGMIPIRPPRVEAHHCADLDDNVRLKEIELERLRLELEEIKAEEEVKNKKERPMWL